MQGREKNILTSSDKLVALKRKLQFGKTEVALKRKLQFGKKQL